MPLSTPLEKGQGSQLAPPPLSASLIVGLSSTVNLPHTIKFYLHAIPFFQDDLGMPYIIDCLPMKHTTAEIIVVNKLLSERETSGLADTKSQFQHDPVSVAAKHRYVRTYFYFLFCWILFCLSFISP